MRQSWAFEDLFEKVGQFVYRVRHVTTIFQLSFQFFRVKLFEHEVVDIPIKQKITGRGEQRVAREYASCFIKLVETVQDRNP